MVVKQVQKDMILFLPVWIFTCTIGIAMYVNISILLSLFSFNTYFGNRVLTVLLRQISYLGSTCLCFQVLGLRCVALCLASTSYVVVAGLQLSILTMLALNS